VKSNAYSCRSSVELSSLLCNVLLMSAGTNNFAFASFQQSISTRLSSECMLLASFAAVQLRCSVVNCSADWGMVNSDPGMYADSSTLGILSI